MQHGVLGVSFVEQKLFYMHFNPSQGEILKTRWDVG